MYVVIHKSMLFKEFVQLHYNSIHNAEHAKIQAHCYIVQFHKRY